MQLSANSSFILFYNGGHWSMCDELLIIYLFLKQPSLQKSLFRVESIDSISIHLSCVNKTH